MRCPHCKAKNPDNAIYCCACDEWILAPVNHEKNPPPNRNFWYQLRSKKRLLITISTITVLCILLLSVLPQLLPQSPTPAPVEPTPIVSNNYILCQQNIEPIEHNGKLSFISDDQLLKTDYTECLMFVTSLDGRTAAALTSDKTLLYIRNHTVTPIATNVTDFELSVTGDGVVFRDTKNSLYHHHVQENAALCIFDSDMADGNILNYSISPDGKTVVYYADDASYNPNYTLWVYQNQQTIPLSTQRSKWLTIISVSNDAQYIYTQDSGIITCYSNQTSITIGQFAAGLSNQLTYSNADHTQLLFHQNDGTYLSVNGQAATCISPEHLESISPELAQSVHLGSTRTEPAKDLCSSLYLSNTTTSVLPNYTLWSFSEDGVCIPLSTNFYSYQLDPTGQYFYYCNGFRDLYLLDTNTIRKPQFIAPDVTQFAITYDNSVLFYATNDATYIRNATGETVTLPTHPRHTVSVLLTSADNHLYQIYGLASNFPSLSTLNGNGQLVVIMQNIRTFSQTASGLLYIDTYKALYLCIDGELKEILAYY